MPTNPVLIFGAGATKACGGPMTNEILPDAFKIMNEIEREGFLDLVNRFLIERFNMPPDVNLRRKDDYPPLPLLLALLDTAIDKKHSFGPNWPLDELVNVRDSLEYLIFALLDYRLRRLKHYFYLDLLNKIKDWGVTEFNVISLNYDIIVDNSMCMLGEKQSGPSFPDYGTDIATDFYRSLPKFGRLLKLHGSLNWLYCPACHRLELGVAESGRGTVKVLNELYNQSPLEPRYGCHGSPCMECNAFVRPVLITPTHLKDYRNPHISSVWYGAERMLRQADRAIIIGYSLPGDDVDVIYLLKRGLEKVPTCDITVVEFDDQDRPLREHPVGQRYRSVFGDNLDWHTEGFGECINNINP